MFGFQMFFQRYSVDVFRFVTVQCIQQVSSFLFQYRLHFVVKDFRNFFCLRPTRCWTRSIWFYRGSTAYSSPVILLISCPTRCRIFSKCSLQRAISFDSIESVSSPFFLRYRHVGFFYVFDTLTLSIIYVEILIT